MYLCRGAQKKACAVGYRAGGAVYSRKTIQQMLSRAEFKQLFDTHFDAIRRFVFYRCGDMDTASDVAQDVFLRVWEKRGSLTASGRPEALLYKMASDTYVSSRRKASVRMDFERSMTPEEDAEPSPEDELSFAELAAAYALALEQMPEKRRVIFLMSREEGLKYREIAENLHLSVKTVEKHMTAALHFLKSKLL
ncbi:MAG: RNA polymerase sigma-70 factor [Tannerella sp.]|jgi:RNA polymerase sigma-70 factor (ECF subfamily)|nr:RNA polymerase sigma-70 factor [Tannerella sp.]